MKILIIEDDKSIAELEMDYLSANGFECELANDGESGLKKALENDYDLVIIDVMLPRRDGFSVCGELRKVKDVPVIFLSARSEDIDKIRGLGLGADDYIAKPFSPSEMVARVKTHISRYKTLRSGSDAVKPEIIEIRGLKVDKGSRRVFSDGKEVIMTVKEYDLLLFLLENPNIVFNKEVLFDRVWGLEAFGDASTVTVHIQRIRDKIEKNSENKYIETVWAQDIGSELSILFCGFGKSFRAYPHTYTAHNSAAYVLVCFFHMLAARQSVNDFFSRFPGIPRFTCDSHCRAGFYAKRTASALAF